MELVKVKSSNLSAVGYEASSNTLRVLFLDGAAAYDYEQVPSTLYNLLLASPSKGTFFQEHIREQFKYTKVNLTKERKTMKKQSAAAAKTVTPAVQPQPAPAPTPAATVVAPAPATPSKQQVTIEKLISAWTEKKVDLSKLQTKQDGKYVLLIVDAGWPTVQIGNSGGITVLELKSYPVAFDAAVDGLARYTKQRERDQKRAAATATPPPTPAPAPAKETPTQRKQKQGAAVEAQLQSA